jgi:hypothetical protein
MPDLYLALPAARPRGHAFEDALDAPTAMLGADEAEVAADEALKPAIAA